ncbi:transporter substrate-binding domain-containing protein [Brotaphodocola sp.]|uniref:transporter substrate-binding domain-containing protein n=1 Tax=Brotaphodocola sp. TaxID=3073577 RepID=UPI003D7DA6CF
MIPYGKWGMSVLMTGLLVISATGCQKKDDISRIQGAGELKVALCEEDEAGQALCDRVANRLGVTLTYVNVEPGEDGIQLVENNQADLAVGGIVTGKELDQGLSMSEPYLQENWYVVTARGDYSDSIEAFRGRMLAVTHAVPDDAFNWTKEASDVNFVGVSAEKAQSAIVQGALQGYVCLEDEALSLADASSAVQMQDLVGSEPLSYAMVTRAADRRLGLVIAEQIGQMAKESEQQ